MTVSTQTKIKLARQVAIIAGGFALLLAVLLIANFVQTKLNNPIENKTIPALVKRLSESPSDEALKAEIRAFDLMARKAYFTSQWQLRTGAYLMFLGLIISVLAVRYILAAKSKLNEIDPANEVKGLDKLVAQKWVIYVGSGLVVVAVVSGFLASNSLNEYMVNENIAASEGQLTSPAATSGNAELATAPADQNTQPEATLAADTASNTSAQLANPAEATPLL